MARPITLREALKKHTAPSPTVELLADGCPQLFASSSFVQGYLRHTSSAPRTDC